MLGEVVGQLDGPGEGVGVDRLSPAVAEVGATCPEEVLIGCPCDGELAGTAESERLGSSGHDGHPLKVVGEDAEAGPDACAGSRRRRVRRNPKRALELADPRLDPDPPVAHPLEHAGPLLFPAGVARRTRAGQPDPLDAKLGKGGVVGRGPNPRSATTVPGARPVSSMTCSTAGTSWAASPGLPLLGWWVAMNPRSSSASSTV